MVPGARLNPFAPVPSLPVAAKKWERRQARSLSDGSQRWRKHGLYRMIQPECNIEELRELIAVPPRIERVSRAYAKAHVETLEFVFKP
jgi:hypothetical protein